MVHVGATQYHTPHDLAEFVIAQISRTPFSTAADICCGSWNLLRAAKKRWPSLQLTGADLDPRAASEMPGDATFHLKDGRMFAVDVIKQGKLFDLVLANPPFGRLQEPSLRKQLSQSVGMLARGKASARIETEMLVANLGLVKEGGCFAAILPRTMIESESYTELRREIAKSFWVKQLTLLPSYAFPGRDVKSCIVVMQRLTGKTRVRPTRRSTAIVLNGNWHRYKQYYVPIANMRVGRWRGDWPDIVRSFTSLETKRGRISSQHLQEDSHGACVLHVSSRPSQGQQWQPKTFFTELEPPRASACTAQNGDIVISRIGKSAGFWTVYRGEEILISDCLIRLRADHQEALISALTQSSDNGCLWHLVKGLTAQYITEQDLHAWLCCS